MHFFREGLNVPSLGVIIRPQTPQGHGANVVSTPENNTTTGNIFL